MTQVSFLKVFSNYYVQISYSSDVQIKAQFDQETCQDHTAKLMT